MTVIAAREAILHANGNLDMGRARLPQPILLIDIVIENVFSVYLAFGVSLYYGTKTNY